MLTIVFHHPLTLSFQAYNLPFFANPSDRSLSCSLAVLDPRVGHTMDVAYFLHLSVSSVILVDSSTESWWRGSVVERRSLAGELSLSLSLIHI